MAGQENHARPAPVIDAVNRAQELRRNGHFRGPDRMLRRHRVKILFLFRENLFQERFHPFVKRPAGANALRDDAEVSVELLGNIFYPKAPLHDGAAVFRQARVAAAGCILPLTKNNNFH